MNLTFSNNLLLTGLMAMSLIAPAAHATEPDPPQTPAAQAQAADSAYNAGTAAMNANRWPDAVTDFDQVIKANVSRADAAMYWKAYALTKLDKIDLANATCSQLRAQFGSSRWNRDCSALHMKQLPTNDSMSTTISVRLPKMNMDLSDMNGGQSKDPDSDIKILALNSLMHRDPAQAVPLLRGILTGDQSVSVKKHALFVLSQSKTPEADALMRDLVVGKMGVDLQREAIQSSGIYRGNRNLDGLVEAYRTTSDDQVKRAVISALFVGGDDTHLVEIARAEKNMEMKRRIVSQLAIMNGKSAQDYMLELLK